jgi:DNA-binding transcriptional LysR family regulator
MASMDLNAVRMLVQVAEARSFTVAAGQLGLSQSGLSRAIGRLEATLGVKLLQRNTRNVALTRMAASSSNRWHRCWPA